MRVVRPMLRIKYSRELSSKNPPLVLPENPFKASSRFSTVTPREAMRPVSGCTWYWRTSPPMGTTWATPGMVKSRGRSTKSAYSRTAIAVVFVASIGSATDMISPMMELTGPMATCSTPWGSCSRATESRSPTIWRAR